MFPVEKRVISSKFRACENDSAQHSYTSKDEASSHTAHSKRALLTAAMKSKEDYTVVHMESCKNITRKNHCNGFRGALVGILNKSFQGRINIASHVKIIRNQHLLAC